MNYKLLYAVVFFLLASPVFSQDDWEDHLENELEEVQVEIVKNREITLPKASRNYEKVPPLPVEKRSTQFRYDFKNFNFEVPPLQFRLRPLKTKPQPLEKLYNGFVKAGFGNYNTPYLEGFYSNKRDKRYNYGIHLKHLSSQNGPIDDENSGTGASLVQAYGRIFSRKVAIGSEISYSNRKNHYYGYNDGNIILADDIEHNFNELNVKAIASSIDTQIAYDVELKYDYISDNYELKENTLSVDFNTDVELKKDNNFIVKGSFIHINQSDSSFSSHKRILAYIQPQYRFTLSGAKIAAGVNVTYADDTLGKLASFRVYPAISADYEISNKVGVNVFFKGATVNNSYRKVSYENAFIAPNNPVYFTNNLYTLGLSLNAQMNAKSTLKVGLDYGSYKNSHFFMNNPNNQSQFLLVYDTGSISVMNFHGQFSYSNGSTVQLSARGDYYEYRMDILQEAWHRPQYKIGIQGIFNLYEKILLITDVAFMGGIKALDQGSSTIVLDPIIDLNFKAEYLFSKRFSVFVHLKNILGNEYQLYSRYPVRGFQVLGGISYSF
ncbi:MAG: hypothetical protein OEX22_02865 [Cyclobacteriaceae bacterium]|nr:hypothetical protein [Cyclobacteriaceae bacterium]